MSHTIQNPRNVETVQLSNGKVFYVSPGTFEVDGDCYVFRYRSQREFGKTWRMSVYAGDVMSVTEAVEG